MQETVEGQLAERQAQKNMYAALKLQEEQGTSAAMATELKAKMEVRPPHPTPFEFPSAKGILWKVRGLQGQQELGILICALHLRNG